MKAAHSALLDRLAASVDPAAATPVYHQIAQVVAREVRSGRLSLGSELPPVRLVARRVGVHYHTVRRAWRELAECGAVRLRRGMPARLDRVPPDDAWTPSGSAPGADPAAAIPLVWVVDHSLERAARLALSLAARWRVRAIPWPAHAGTPPPGAILGTGQVSLARWPEREAESGSVPLALEPATAAQVLRAARRLHLTRVTIVTGTGTPPLAELGRQLPRLGLVTNLRPDVPLEPEGEVLYLVEPAAWDLLDWSRRSDPHLMPLEFTWSAGPLARLARGWGWGLAE